MADLKTTGQDQVRDAKGRIRKGHSGNPNGRRKGVPNKATLEQKEFARQVPMSDEYRAGVIRRVVAGEAPHLEILMHHQAFGKPKETTALEGLEKMPFQVVLLGPRRDPLAEPKARPALSGGQNTE